MSFKNISFILHNPQLSENIGACARAIKNFSFNKLLLVNPKPVFPNDKILATSVGAKDIIKKASNVQVTAHFESELNLIPEDIPLDIIDETDDYIVINKPSGIVTHVAPGNYQGTLQNAIYFKYPELSKVPRTGIIHRLDKDTSGIIVIARTSLYHNYLTEQLHGIYIQGETTIGEAVLTSDKLGAALRGTVIGARTVKIEPTGSDTYQVELAVSQTHVDRLIKAYRSGLL